MNADEIIDRLRPHEAEIIKQLWVGGTYSGAIPSGCEGLLEHIPRSFDMRLTDQGRQVAERMEHRIRGAK